MIPTVQIPTIVPWTQSIPSMGQRIQRLVHQYVTPDLLSDRLEDLPAQFHQPRPRPWARIPWASISCHQLQGLAPETFCRILAGAINTEAPIRNYTQASRQYLDRFYPQMAKFVGGTLAASGQVKTPGLWEIEEKRHTPALIRIYTQISGKPPTPVPHSARPYTPGRDPREDLYRHGLHRIATEYGATCLYLWMMAHTTGPLEAALGELVIDEVNHMTKFWGFGRWAYAEASLGKNVITLGRGMAQKLRHPPFQGSLIHTLRRMMGELAWADWSPPNRLTFLYTLQQVMQVLYRWDQTLTRNRLTSLFGHHDSHL